MADDGGLRPLFRERLVRGFQWTSVETGATVAGVPDAEFCAEGGVQGWVEFKATDAWSVWLRTKQISWHTERYLRGGWSVIATRRRHEGGPRRGPPVDELWLHAGRWAARLRAEGLRGDIPALGVWEGGPSRWDWEGVRAALLRPNR